MFDYPPHLYDALYDAAGKDYEHESRFVLDWIRACNPGAKTLLDVACGTGRHVEYFSRELRCVGLDLSDGLLGIARERCSDARFVQGDMVDFKLDEQFDAVTCLFSSIGYVRTPERLERAIQVMAEHVVPGGVLAIEPSFRPDTWQIDRIGAVFVDQPDLKAARIGNAARDGNRVIMNLHYLIGANGDVSYLKERHEMGLFDWEQYCQAFERLGLTVQIDEEGPYGRGLLIGVKDDIGGGGDRG